MMEEMGLDFEIMPAHIDEKTIRDADPKKLTMKLALAKADVLIPRITGPAILITSDQVVVCNGEILEKPENAAEAEAMLTEYAAHNAENINAIVVTNTANGKQASANDVSGVAFLPFSDEDIQALLDDGEVYLLAGGFNIEGNPIWEAHVKEIIGTRDSVLGLPKEVTKRLIHEVSA